MSSVKKPEPVAEVVCTHAHGWSTRWIGEENGKRNVPPLESKLITTEQNEAYAAERVREALEQAADICKELQCSPELEPEVKDNWLAIAEKRIRELMKKGM